MLRLYVTMLPSIFQPPDTFAVPPLPRRYTKRGTAAVDKPKGKLIILPQTFIIFSNTNEKTFNDTGKQIGAIARFTTCQTLSDEEMHGPALQQIRIWQNRRKYQTLTGSYVTWQIDFVHLLKSPVDLSKVNPPCRIVGLTACRICEM